MCQVSTSYGIKVVLRGIDWDGVGAGFSMWTLGGMHPGLVILGNSPELETSPSRGIPLR